MAEQQFPSHVPIIASSGVVWSPERENWILKTWNDAIDLPNRGHSVVWNCDFDRWECLSYEKEIGNVVWNRYIYLWELLPFTLEDTPESSVLESYHQSLYPTHLPDLEGMCAFTFNANGHYS